MPGRTNNKPMPVAKAPPPAAAPKPMPKPMPLQQGPSVTDSIKQGFSFGIGSAIAHNMVNRVFGKPESALPTTPLPTTPLPTTPITTPQQDKMYELYYQCMEKNDKNVNCSDILN
jgi:hypothetical protein